MKTPILTYKSSLTKETVQQSIKSRLDAVAENPFDLQTLKYSIQRMCRTLCYAMFYVTGEEYEDQHSYTFYEIVDNVKGIYCPNLIQLGHNLVAIQEFGKSTANSLKNVLKDCMSYETLQALYNDPVQVYATFLFCYVVAIRDEKNECSEAAVKYMREQRKRPTLEWEDMYLKFTERYGDK